MSRPILSRPRTRVYGCNYDKGESYYKPAIENLNRKYSGRPLFPEPRNSLADEIAARRSDIGTRDLAGSRHGAGVGRSELDNDYEALPSRRSLASSTKSDAGFFDDEDTVFDIHGRRTSRGPRHLLGDDFASEVSSTTNRLKQRMHLIDEEVQSSSSNAAQEASNRRRARFHADTKEMLDDLAKPTPMAKWTKVENEPSSIIEDFSSAAAGRAKMSKARLDDLELEMEEMAEKQARRERRSAALRALINETSSAADESLASASKLSVHRSEKRSRNLGGRSDSYDDLDYYYGRGYSEDPFEDEFVSSQRRFKDRATAAFDEDVADLRRKRRDVQDRLFDMIDLNAEIEKARNTLQQADNVFGRHALRFDNEAENPENMSMAQRLERARKLAAMDVAETKTGPTKWTKLVPVEEGNMPPQMRRSSLVDGTNNPYIEKLEPTRGKRGYSKRKKSVSF